MASALETDVRAHIEMFSLIKKSGKCRVGNSFHFAKKYELGNIMDNVVPVNAGDVLHEIKLIPFHELTVGAQILFFDVFNLLELGMFRFDREDKFLYLLYPFRSEKDMPVAGGYHYVAALTYLYLHFGGIVFKRKSNNNLIGFECQQCFSKLTIMLPVDRHSEVKDYDHCKLCVRRFNALRGDTGPGWQATPLKRATLLVFFAKYLVGRKLSARSLMTLFNTTIGGCLSVLLRDAVVVLQKIDILATQGAIVLATNFVFAFNLFRFDVRTKLEDIKGKDVKFNVTTSCFACADCKRTFKMAQKEMAQNQSLNPACIHLCGNGITQNPCPNGCVVLCSVCYTKKHILVTPEQTNFQPRLGKNNYYYNAQCGSCKKPFERGKFARSVIGITIMDSVPCLFRRGRPMYTNGNANVVDKVLVQLNGISAFMADNLALGAELNEREKNGTHAKRSATEISTARKKGKRNDDSSMDVMESPVSEYEGDEEDYSEEETKTAATIMEHMKAGFIETPEECFVGEELGVNADDLTDKLMELFEQNGGNSGGNSFLPDLEFDEQK